MTRAIVNVARRVERERILLLFLAAKAAVRHAKADPRRWHRDTVALFEADAQAHARAYARLRGWRFRRALRIGWRKTKASRVVQPVIGELRAAFVGGGVA
jgi:hypothetical protein